MLGNSCSRAPTDQTRHTTDECHGDRDACCRSNGPALDVNLVVGINSIVSTDRISRKAGWSGIRGRAIDG